MGDSTGMPTVSVYVLCYNTGKYVVEALRSIAATGYPALDVIVIDDHSTDGVSADLLENWIKETGYACQFIRHQENWGICRSLNQAISLCKGKYAAGLGDDLWLPNRLDAEVKYMEEHSDVGLVFGNADIINEYSELTGATYGDREKFLTIDRTDSYLKELEKGNYLVPPACLFRVSLLKELNGFDEKLKIEDWDMYLRIARSGHRIKYMDHSVVQYRKYSTSVWHSRSPWILMSCIEIYEKHDLFTKSDTFISYLNHFNIMPWKDKRQVLGALASGRKWTLWFIVAVSFLKAPLSLQYRIYHRLVGGRTQQ